jgi:hypothetical protein
MPYKDITSNFVEFASQNYRKLIKQATYEIDKHPQMLSPLLRENFMDFILVGYSENIPQIKHISLKDGVYALENPICELHNYYYTGVIEIADYWVKLFANHLYSMDIENLKRLCIFLISQSEHYSAVGGKYQMLVILNDNKLSIIPDYKISDIKNKITTIANTEISSFLNQICS